MGDVPTKLAKSGELRRKCSGDLSKIGKLVVQVSGVKSGFALTIACSVWGKCWDRSHVVQGGDDLGHSGEVSGGFSRSPS
jgi:hypothetical protein